jgi:hypothetical protein
VTTPRTSPDPESGQAILICEFFTLDHAPTLQLGKSSTVPFSTLNNQTHLDQVHLARLPSEKSQKQLLLATQNNSSEATRRNGHRQTISLATNSPLLLSFLFR